MHWTDPLTQVPNFSERPSGLVVPVEHSRPAVSQHGERHGDGTPIAKDAFFIMANPPSALEQMRVVLDESGVGLPVSTPEELGELVSGLSFENAMLAISRLACHAWQIRGDTQAQLDLTPTIFGDPDLVAAIERLVRRDPERLEIFPEQHAAVLQRLLMLEGRDALLGDMQEGEQATFNRAWLAAAAVTAELDRDPPTGSDGRQHWITYLIQNGTYNRTNDGLSSMMRPQILLRDIAGCESAHAHPQYCDVDAWHTETFGFGLADQFSLGLAVVATSAVFDKDAPISKRSLVGRAYLANVTKRLGLDFDQVQELLSARREWYRTEFEQRENTVTNMAWDRVPFEARPLLQLSNGEFLALSPRSIESWLGDGFYHRTLSAARQRDEVKRFQTFYGSLVEEHALRVLRHVHPKTGPLASCQVFGEQQYGRGGGKRSPDIAVDCGPDLILFEVCSGRFTLRTVVEGSQETALDELARLIFGKARQLDHRIDEFLAGRWCLPGVDSRQIERIWPVIVSADVLQNEMLWDETREQLSGVLNQPKVQQLTLLDLSELEQLAALVEHGHGLLHLLATKARGPYAELDFRRFVAETPTLPADVRLSLLDERWFKEIDRTAEALGFDPNSADAIEARRRREKRRERRTG